MFCIAEAKFHPMQIVNFHLRCYNEKIWCGKPCFVFIVELIEWKVNGKKLNTNFGVEISRFAMMHLPRMFCCIKHTGISFSVSGILAPNFYLCYYLHSIQLHAFNSVLLILFCVPCLYCFFFCMSLNNVLLSLVADLLLARQLPWACRPSKRTISHVGQLTSWLPWKGEHWKHGHKEMSCSRR